MSSNNKEIIRLHDAHSNSTDSIEIECPITVEELKERAANKFGYDASELMFLSLGEGWKVERDEQLQGLSGDLNRVFCCKNDKYALLLTPFMWSWAILAADFNTPKQLFQYIEDYRGWEAEKVKIIMEGEKLDRDSEEEIVVRQGTVLYCVIQVAGRGG
eukprot:TRINITY_DN5628_c0_g1_i1.p1 TRINITY_DN5628_c0_g1~~TRINITY_DN5628_c0_g1_i1.p1  ORF type:complete len:159 (+),score=38.93 TRINITY_DN5628_c0_g1_i1:72-548(+)